jgi:malonyl-CoA O-methyltransferase
VSDEYFLDPRLVRRSFDAASATFDANAIVHGEIRKRLLERLDPVRLAPGVVVDLGAGTGAGSRALKQRYRAAQVIAIDLSMGMLQEAAKQQRLLRRFPRIVADARHLPLRAGSIDLVFSNLMLQWCNEPDAVFAEARRILRPNGLFIFTTLGPDTLRELRVAWRQVDRRPHVHRFIDMHDLGDALLRAGFSEPVMDTERLTVTYATLDALRHELKGSGSRNICAGRSAGLTGRRQHETLQASAEVVRTSGTLAFALEVVYGHAWLGQPRASVATDGETRVPVAAIRRRSFT